MNAFHWPSRFRQVPRSEQTRETYRKVLTQFVDEIGGGRRLGLIRPEDPDAYWHILICRQWPGP